MIAYYDFPNTFYRRGRSDVTRSSMDEGDPWNQACNNDPNVTYIFCDSDPFEKKTDFHPFALYVPKPEERAPKVLLLNIIILCILINRHCGGYQKNSKRRAWTGHNFCKRYL